MNCCPHCGQAISESRLTVDDLRRRCEEKGIRVLDGNLISEPGAAVLMGYARADSLRKQVSEYGGRIPFLLRGNRRLYSLESLAIHVPG